jgi:soluble lytic murein transglycosylase-like protein
MISTPCIQQSASYYGVPVQAIEIVLAAHAAHPTGIGPMGIPESWVPLLRSQGFELSKLQNNVCENIRAGAWILKVAPQREIHPPKAPVAPMVVAPNPIPVTLTKIQPGPVRVTSSSRLPACALQAATIYGVPLAAVRDRLSAVQGGYPGNPMGISSQALVTLKAAGFSENAVTHSPCMNMAAGIWLLANSKVGVSSSGGHRPLSTMISPVPPTLKPIIQEASVRNGVPKNLVKAVIDQESGYRTHALSSAGAQGLMQLLPGTAKMYGAYDPYDARQNIFAGVAYLADLLHQFDGSIPMALAAYNAGPGAVEIANGIPRNNETQGYVPSVMGKYLLYNAASESDAP